MKIKVISRSIERAKQLAQLVKGPGLDVKIAPDLTFVSDGTKLIIIDEVNAADLNAIGELSLTNPDTEFIICSTEQSPAFLLKAMQVGVREVLQLPVNEQALSAAVQRLARKHGSTSSPSGEVLAFIACKGGSGTSFLAANLAHVLSERGKNVALIDLNLQFGDALMMLTDQRAKSDIGEVGRNVNRLDADLLRSAMIQVSDTLSVLPVPADLSLALNVNINHVEAIIKQAQQLFDFVVLDAGRSIDALSLQALDMATTIFPVMQLNVPQLRDAKRLHELFRSLEYPAQKVHWLINRYHKGGELSLEALEQALNTKGLKASTIPNHFPSVNASVNQGEPISNSARGNPVARALNELSLTLVPAEEKRRSSWLDRFS